MHLEAHLLLLLGGKCTKYYMDVLPCIHQQMYLPARQFCFDIMMIEYIFLIPDGLRKSLNVFKDKQDGQNSCLFQKAPLFQMLCEQG